MQDTTVPKPTLVAIGAALALIGACVAVAASPATRDAPPTGAAAPGPVRQTVADMNGPVAARDATGNDPAQSRNAARSRMRECGHQWSSMKKSGAANGMTWKDFSQGCLAKQ